LLGNNCFLFAAAADNKTLLAFTEFVFYAHGGGEPRVGACLLSAPGQTKMETNIKITVLRLASFRLLSDARKYRSGKNDTAKDKFMIS
jgi:hypothetical protein